MAVQHDSMNPPIMLAGKKKSIFLPNSQRATATPVPPLTCIPCTGHPPPLLPHLENKAVKPKQCPGQNQDIATAVVLAPCGFHYLGSKPVLLVGKPQPNLNSSPHANEDTLSLLLALVVASPIGTCSLSHLCPLPHVGVGEEQCSLSL